MNVICYSHATESSIALLSLNFHPASPLSLLTDVFGLSVEERVVVIVANSKPKRKASKRKDIDTMFCCCSLAPQGPARHFLSSFLLTASTVAVLVCLRNHESIEDTATLDYQLNDGNLRRKVPTVDEQIASERTALALFSLVIIFAGIATIVFLVEFIMTTREDAERRREEEKHHRYEKRRNWFDKFLDPRFLNTPKHIQLRNWHFRSLINPSSVWKWGFYAPSVALSIMLVIRLFRGEPVWLGNPKALDFGWKYGIITGVDAEKNTAFTLEFNSYGHAMQGFFAALLATPVVQRGLLHLTRGRFTWLVQLAPFPLTIYPTYNLIKRFVKSRKAFAGSSFANNGFEWAAGFILGLALGQLITAIRSVLFLFYARSVKPNSKPSSSKDVEKNQKGFEEDEEIPSDDEDELFETSCTVGMLQRMFGLLLLFTVFAAGVLYGTTWYSCLEGTKCLNALYGYDANGEETTTSPPMLATMIMVPLLTVMLSMAV